MRLPAAIACALLAPCGSGEPCGYPGNYCQPPERPGKQSVSSPALSLRAVMGGLLRDSWLDSLRPAGNCASGQPEYTKPTPGCSRVSSGRVEHARSSFAPHGAGLHPSEQIPSLLAVLLSVSHN